VRHASPVCGGRIEIIGLPPLSDQTLISNLAPTKSWTGESNNLLDPALARPTGIAVGSYRVPVYWRQMTRVLCPYKSDFSPTHSSIERGAHWNALYFETKDARAT
jgi:hypothetical protein